MLPGFSFDDVADSLVPDPEGSRYLHDRHAALKCGTHGDDLVLFQDAQSLPFATGLSALGYHVLAVVGGCTYKQVLRVDAERSIAFMQDPFAPRDLPKSEFPYKAVAERRTPTTIGAHDLNHPVAFTGLVAPCPFDAPGVLNEPSAATEPHEQICTVSSVGTNSFHLSKRTARVDERQA